MTRMSKSPQKRGVVMTLGPLKKLYRHGMKGVDFPLVIE